MNGVTIVAEHLCRVTELGELITIGIVFTLVSIGGLLFYWWEYKYINHNHKNIRIVFSIFVIILNIILWMLQINRYNTTHIEYTIIADNSVILNDFYEKYEIVSVNGNEFRVIEK